MSETKHPSSDNLRQLADWLDAHGSNLRIDLIYATLIDETPETLRAFIQCSGATVSKSDYSWLTVSASICGISLNMAPTAKRVSTTRTVMREVEEIVIPGVANAPV